MASAPRTSTRDLIRLAALRNCEGASHLAEEELEEAVANFTEAYHCIGQAVARGRDDEDDEDADADEEDCLPSESVDKYHFILDTTEVAWYAASRVVPDDTTHHSRRGAAAPVHDTAISFIAKEALVFPPESASDPGETPFFEAVILFNMALAFDTNGRNRATFETNLASRKSCLCRSLFCYTQCLRLLKEGNYDHSITSIHANRLVEAHLLVASLNNKAQVLFALEEYHQAFWSLQELGSVLASSAGSPPGFKASEIRGLEATMELLSTPEMTAVRDTAMAAATSPVVATRMP